MGPWVSIGALDVYLGKGGIDPYIGLPSHGKRFSGDHNHSCSGSCIEDRAYFAEDPRPAHVGAFGLG